MGVGPYHPIGLPERPLDYKFLFSVEGLVLIRLYFDWRNSARVKIKPGQCVLIVLKKNQQSGKLTKGIVKDFLTKALDHPHGIKVRLESGEIGRVKKVLE
jgi:uncharacterized repeat protein (TIGR03833 family)